jgi:Flp pilus assembly protein TadG
MRGQALVEMAIAMPILLVLALGVVGAGRAIHARVALEAAAREGARAVATAPDPCDAAVAVARARETAQGYGLALEQLTVEVSGGCDRGSLRRVMVGYTVPLRDLVFMPFLQLPGQVTMTARATHVVEQYRSR